MIDTEKYEGHTPAPWDVREAGINRIMVYTDDEGFAYEEANRNLVTDAPLLLEEVLRLREAFIIAVRHVGEHDLSRDDLFSKLDEDLFSLWLFRSE